MASVRRIVTAYTQISPLPHTVHQRLSQDDYGQTLNFYEWFRNRILQDANFFNALFSDKATIFNTGLVNSHNFHYCNNTLNPPGASPT